MHQRQLGTDGVTHCAGVGVRHEIRKMRRDLGEGARLCFQQVTAFRQHSINVEYTAIFRDAFLGGVQYWLHCPTQPQIILGSHQMQGSAHHRRADDLALLDQRCQIVPLETTQARPQPDIRRQRQLRLHPGQPLDGVSDGQGVAFEQHLPRQCRAVQFAGSQDALSHW